MTDNDEQVDARLREGFNSLQVPPVDEGAKRRAIASAMAEFETQHAGAEKEKTTNYQGLRNRLRLIVSTIANHGREIMSVNQRVLITGLTAACVGVIAVSVSLQSPPGAVKLPDPIREEIASVLGESKNEVRGRRIEDQVADLARANMPVSKVKSPADKNVPQEQFAPAMQEIVVTSSQEALAAAPARMVGKVLSADMAASSQLRKMAPGTMAEADIMLPPSGYQDVGRDRFEAFEQNPVQLVTEAPVSTFSVDVDTASYSFVRRQLNHGVLPQGDAVRAEELINYFDYDYPLPTSEEQPFAPSVTVSDSPWAEGRKLMHIGIKGYDLEAAEKPRTNLVFLLDVSGSMNSPDKLPLVKQSMELLLTSLDPDDTVAIAVYAGAAGTVLEPTAVKDKQKIINAMNQLQAGGSTAGAQGIRLAYELAEAQFDPAAINRVILATDGDFNVGITTDRELQSFIERKREKGVFLSVLGFGQGNYQDQVMQTLAQNGNGVAAYIDTLSEAQKVLVDEATSTLFPIARDVKIQLEFNPATVAEYRLVGYETRHLEREDFNNDAVDAGDIGAGHTVTAIYEFTPVGSAARQIEESRYAVKPNIMRESDEGEYAFLKIRYKLPEEDQSRLITQPITRAAEVELGGKGTLTREAGFATAVAGFAQLLKGGKYTGEYSYDDVIALAQQNRGEDAYGYRTEFVQLARKAKTAAAMQTR
jgi:Ca-activated chloride channel family protein